MAAIVTTWKSSVYQTTNTAATVTASPTWTPTANSLLVACVCTAYSSSPTDPTGVTGHGVTYSALTLGTSTLSTTHKLSIWVAKAGGSPSSTACVAAVTNTNGTGDLIIEFEVTGADVSGTALQAIVASSATNTGSGTAQTVTLAAASAPGNRPLVFGVHLSNTAPTAAGSWTLTAGAAGNFNTPATGASAVFNNTTFDVNGAATGANVAWRMVGIEIAAAKEGSDSTVRVSVTEAAFGVGTATDDEALGVIGNEAAFGSGTATQADASSVVLAEIGVAEVAGAALNEINAIDTPVVALIDAAGGAILVSVITTE